MLTTSYCLPNGDGYVSFTGFGGDTPSTKPDVSTDQAAGSNNAKVKAEDVLGAAGDLASLVSQIVAANSKSEVEKLRLQIAQTNATSAEQLKALEIASNRQAVLAASAGEQNKTSRTVIWATVVLMVALVVGFFGYLIVKTLKSE